MQIVNDAIDPRSVRQALEELGFGISAIVAAEKGLLKDKAGRISAQRREAQAHDEAETVRLDMRLLEIDSDYKERNALAHAAAQARAARARQAYHASKSSLARRMQEKKDSRIGRVQGDIMRKRQTRQQQLAQAVAEHESFQKALMDDRAARRQIRQNLLSACRTVAPALASWFDGRRKFDAVQAAATPEATRAAMLKAIDDARAASDDAAKKPLLRFFRFVPLTVLLLVVAGMHLWYGMRAGGGGLRAMLPSLIIAEGVLLALWGIAFSSSLSVLKRAASALAGARALEAAAEEQAAARLAALTVEIQHEENVEGRDLSETFRESGEEWRARMAEGQRELDERFTRVSSRMERLYQRKISKLDAAREQEITRIRMEFEERARHFGNKQDVERSAIDAEADAQLAKLIHSWKTGVRPLHDRLVVLNENSTVAFPEWTNQICESWEPPAAAPSAVRIGQLHVDAAKLAGALPGHAGLDLTDGGDFAVPFSLAFPDEGSLLIETDGPDDGSAARVLHAAALRLLASHPPGRASFLFIDPVGLGKDFAGLMHLADYEETLITSRIWTQTTHIEERLAEINEHIEKVIQMYLRDEFADIHAYNERAGAIAEKFRFLVIAGFPAAFSDTAARRLRSIAASGSSTGIRVNPLPMRRLMMNSAASAAASRSRTARFI
jgi:hypothetical protein